jgi:hypothetical protein
MDSDRDRLRPVERAVLRHVDAGLPNSEIAWRFRRTPRSIHQIRQLSAYPRRERSTDTGGLRAVERCVLKARDAGADHAEIAARLRRSPSFVARVEDLAGYKLRTGRATS